MQGFEIRVCSADAVDGDGAAVDADFRAERAGGLKGGFAVGAGGISAEMAPAFGEGGGDDCALREALGCGHLQGIAEESAPTAVDLPVHCEVVDLPGGGGFFVGEGCVAEGCAPLQAFDAGCAAFRAHCKGQQAAAIRDGQRAGPCPTRGAQFAHCPSVRLTRTIQRHDAGGVISGMGGDDDFSDVGAVAIATVAHLLQVLQIRSAAKVVEGTYDFRAALFADVAEALAERCVRLQFQIREARSGADGHAEPAFRLLSSDLRNAAGRYEGGVGVGEQVFYLVVGKLAAVQTNLRHLNPRIVQKGQNLLVCLVLYCSANHILVN